MKKIILLLVTALCGIVVFHLSLWAYFYFLKLYFPMRGDVAYGLLLHYGKLCFSLLMVVSSMVFLLRNKGVRLFLLLLLFVAYSSYWYPALEVYPYRISFLLLISAVVYSGMCLFIKYKVLKKYRLSVDI